MEHVKSVLKLLNLLFLFTDSIEAAKMQEINFYLNNKKKLNVINDLEIGFTINIYCNV